MLVNIYQPAHRGETSRSVAFTRFRGVNTPPGEISDDQLDIGVGDMRKIGPHEPMGVSPNTPAERGEGSGTVVPLPLSQQDRSSRQQCGSDH